MILLLDLDSRIPNLALMRIAQHHRDLGDEVELRRVGNARHVEPRFGDPKWDRVYASAVFSKTRPLAERVQRIYPTAFIGGTGWDRPLALADVGISDGPLDYSVYPKQTASIGFAMRGCRMKCSFCVVPEKEGAARHNATIGEIWRGDPWPRDLILLDNDFFGNPNWPAVITAIRDGGFRVSICQGINARTLTDEAAAAIASINYRSISLREKRIYTAWDMRGHEKPLFRGLRALAKYGVKPDDIMVYMLIGHEAGETHEIRDYRRRQLLDFGARPYPMPFDNGDPGRMFELRGYCRWVVQGWHKKIPWEEWRSARFSPRRLGDRVTLPLFGGEDNPGDDN